MNGDETMPRAPRNRTLDLAPAAVAALAKRLLAPAPGRRLSRGAIVDRVICADFFAVAPSLPEGFADLLVLDPPYNLDRDFHGARFRRMGDDAYRAYLESWLPLALRALKPEGSVYLCCDWRCTAAAYAVMAAHLRVRNRITWQREKGRAAARNWKNACEDIWFATRGDDYYFDAAAVRLRRRVRAPYREGGRPKDWEETPEGGFRMTAPGTVWDDISVPYWSMPENTDHPTQKPEKLLAKLVLASCPPGGVVFDPFLGSGTTAVVARKLGRHFCGVERDREYGAWALARLDRARRDPAIQGYAGGVFWERNSSREQSRERAAAARPGRPA
ncbi:MAG: site-specific DNA-methyltransferase [Planctomycetes bacterium]|nr:site-specific DNA-methyltransferase [Planctomycetota bacterium]